MLPRVEDVLLRLGYPGLALLMFVSPAGHAVLAVAAGVYVLRVARLRRGARR
jgi:hypothetical protein